LLNRLSAVNNINSAMSQYDVEEDDSKELEDQPPSDDRVKPVDVTQVDQNLQCIHEMKANYFLT